MTDRNCAMCAIEIWVIRDGVLIVHLTASGAATI